VLVSQLIVAPVLVFDAWLYLLLVRRRDVAGRVRAVDVAVIGAAAAACLALLPVVAGIESGGNDRIWHPVLSTLTTFFVFPSVLLIGLALRGAAVRRG
jgi:hypothetical protein